VTPTPSIDDIKKELEATLVTAIVTNTLDVGAPIIDAGTDELEIVEDGKVNVSEDLGDLVCANTDWEDIPNQTEDCTQYKWKKSTGVKRKDWDTAPLEACKAGNDALMDTYKFC